MKTYDVFVKFLNTHTSFLISPTRAAEYTTVNTDDVVVKCPKRDKISLTSPTRTAEYTTVNTDGVVRSLSTVIKVFSHLKLDLKNIPQ